MTQNAFYTRLNDRGLIHIEGAERYNFLQGLITNDIKKLAPGKLLYACLLNPQGKFLYDFFLSEGDGFILIECEGGARAADLFKRLNMYRLRSDVQISIEENVPVYAVFGTDTGLPDPRHPDMGRRSYEKPDLEECTYEEWDVLRIKFRIPDGSRDLVPEKSTMDEARMDRLSAIDYNKGCYIGQELTARMYHRGLGKKHLYAFESESMPTFGDEIRANDSRIGEMRSSCGNVGLALIKDDTLHLLKDIGLILV